LGGFLHLTDSQFLRCLKSCPNLLHIGIGGCSKLTNASIQGIADNCTKLIDLNAHNLANINFSAIDILLSKCNRLRTLEISGCKALTAQQIVYIQCNYPATEDDWFDYAVQ